MNGLFFEVGLTSRFSSLSVQCKGAALKGRPTGDGWWRERADRHHGNREKSLERVSWEKCDLRLKLSHEMQY